MEDLKNEIRAILTESKYLTTDQIIEIEHQIQQIAKKVDRRSHPQAILHAPGTNTPEIEPLVPQTGIVINIDFLKLVERMRDAQRTFFATRDRVVMGQAKRIEEEVDRQIAEYKKQILPGA